MLPTLSGNTPFHQVPTLYGKSDLGPQTRMLLYVGSVGYHPKIEIQARPIWVRKFTQTRHDGVQTESQDGWVSSAQSQEKIERRAQNPAFYKIHMVMIWDEAQIQTLVLIGLCHMHNVWLWTIVKNLGYNWGQKNYPAKNMYGLYQFKLTKEN